MVKLIMMVGIPGSGKSFIANSISKDENAIIHSSDELRKELFNNVDNQKNNALLFEELHKRIYADLKRGVSVIYDATNLNSKKRKGFLSNLHFLQGIFTEVIIVATTLEQSIINNQKRSRIVPTNVIDRMYRSFQFPLYSEGWSNIIVNNPFSEIKSITLKMKQLNNFNQENSHHSLSLGRHMYKTLENYNGKYPLAAYLHDVGKEFTKSFINRDGVTIDSNAHYYNHENISSYESMFYLYLQPDLIPSAQLIQLHMTPYIENISSFKSKAGVLYEELILLNKADREAH